jgi:hypothetical protein
MSLFDDHDVIAVATHGAIPFPVHGWKNVFDALCTALIAIYVDIQVHQLDISHFSSIIH